MAAAAAGGRVAAPKPVLQHTAAGQFTIQNYNSDLTYTISAGTRSGAVITLPSANQSCTVTARGQKGTTESTAGTCERKSYTAAQGTPDVSFVHASPEHGVNIPSSIGSRWLYCRDFPWGGESGHQEGVMVKDTSPSSSGFVDQYGEWGKVT